MREGAIITGLSFAPHEYAPAQSLRHCGFHGPTDMARNVLLALASCASFCLLYAHAFDCSNQTATQMKCFQDAGLQVVSQASVQVSNVIMSEVAPLCRNLSAYQDAAACATNVTLQCLPSAYVNYYPSVAATNSVMAKICENIAAIKFDCLQSVHFKINECSITKTSAYQSDGSAFSLLCFIYKAGVECINEVFRTCGCQTTKLYVEIFKVLNPPACSAIPVSTPVCLAGTDEFANAANTQRISLLPLFVFAFCGLYGKM